MTRPSAPTLALCAAIIAVVFVTWLSAAPASFPSGQVIEVREGASLQSVSTDLESRGIIRSKAIFRTLVILMGGERGVVAGLYSLDGAEGAYKMARRIVEGDYRVATTRITIPEGSTNSEIADILTANLPRIDKEGFMLLAASSEGRLFPDTYFFFETATSGEVIERMISTYVDKVGPLGEELVRADAELGRTSEDILVMASILEGEANTPESRKIVSGILWNRIEAKMPLQVDTTFERINGKTSAELTLDDLAIDSPYNTYVYRGLPPTPINNPGLEAIDAALNPEESDYLYFLTGDDGEMYYAEDFEGHKLNKEKYIK